jgi:hypothetical protein
MDPFARQRRVPEIGDSGQRLLAQTAVTVGGDRDAARWEIEYLSRAGVARVHHEPAAPALAFQHAAQFYGEAPLAIATGAWRALARLRGLLGVSAS